MPEKLAPVEGEKLTITDFEALTVKEAQKAYDTEGVIDHLLSGPDGNENVNRMSKKLVSEEAGAPPQTILSVLRVGAGSRSTTGM